MEILHMDIFHIDKTYILTILDKFSRFARGQILEARNSINIADKLLQFFANRGILNKIITDNAKEFTSSLIKEILDKYNIVHHVTSQKNSTGNSPVERLHSSLIEIYRIISQRDKQKTKSEKIAETMITHNNYIQQLHPHGKYNENRIKYKNIT